MKKITLLSLAAIAALATEPVTIQKITVEAEAPKGEGKKVAADEMVKFSRQSDLGEMLSNTLPEVTLVRNSGVGNDIILRGLRKDNINVTIDDAKVCGACPNRMDPPAMHVSSSQIANVEVKEGPFDVTQFGSLGGKINVVTKDPSKGVHGEVSATAGSFDYRKLSTTLEAGNDSIQALVGFSRETSGQYKDGNGRTLSEQTDYVGTAAGQKYAAKHKEMDAYDRNNYWAKIVGKIGNNQKLTLNYFGDRADDIMFPRYPMDALKDVIDYGVIGLLLLLSVWSVAVAIERWLFYKRINFSQFSNAQLLEITLTQRLVIIGTVAANAPYIGLLGTVLGIMLTFHTMGTSGTMAVNTIMIGLSLALKATAVGLLVAIPCVVMNNLLRRRVTELLTEYKAQHGSEH